MVCRHAASVLGHSSSHDVDAQCSFADLGFESMAGVELRNRLAAATGLVLPRTLVFDYPTAAALADHLGHQLTHGYNEESEDDRIWVLLKNIPIAELRRTGLLDKLALLAGEPEKLAADPQVTEDAIDSLSPDALIALALNTADRDETH
ncbi:acyl carrier protein [Mycobacterium simiae]